MELNFSPLNSNKPQMGNIIINNHDLNQISDYDSSDFKLSSGSSTSSTAGFSLMQRTEAMEAMREAVFREAAMQPVEIDAESLRPPPERKNVKISKDPQSVVARRRREKISHRMRVLQRMVPGGMKLDTASMLDEAAHYLRFLKKQIELLEQVPAEDYRPVMDDGFFPGGAN